MSEGAAGGSASALLGVVAVTLNSKREQRARMQMCKKAGVIEDGAGASTEGCSDAAADVDFFSKQLFGPQVARRLHALRARAKELGRSVLLRLHVPYVALAGAANQSGASGFDPWALLPGSPQEAELQGPYVAWHHGRGGLTAAALGVADALSVDGTQRFETAQQYCSRLLEEVADVGCGGDGHATHTAIPTDLPLTFGGFAFAARPDGSDASGQGSGAGAFGGAGVATCDDSPWAAWPDGWLMVPQVLAYRDRMAPSGGDGVAGFVVHTRLAFEDVPGEVLGRCAALLRDAWRRWLAFATHPCGVAQGRRGGGADEGLALHLREEASSWHQRVQDVRDAVGRGPLEKVVLARGADYEAPPGQVFDAPAMLRRLRETHADGFCFAFSRPGAGCFLGASPEVLVTVSGRRVTTQALAGTAPRGATTKEDEALGASLVASLKDQREHQIVAEALYGALGPLCAELNRAPAPRLFRLPRVQHLETPYAGKLRAAGNILGLVARLHPTPSVGGWPSGVAQAWLQEREPLARGWYAGPVGWQSAAGEGVYAVAIRSLLVRGGRAHAFAGAGIVQDSDPQLEWRETELKLQTAVGACTLAPDSSACELTEDAA